MKKFNLSLAVVTALSFYSSANAQSLAEALTDGKVSGEFTATYEKRDFDSPENTYYQNTAYSVGSFALKYETGVWNDLSLTSKFRAYTTLFEDDEDSTTSHGRGDASERFYRDGSNKSVAIEELFLSYEPNDNFSVKAGRQFISSHWVNKTNDALKIDTSFGNTSLEAIWALRHGRVYARDYRPLNKSNGDDGVFQLAVRHKFNDMFSVAAYDRIEADVRDIYGAKVNAKLGNVSLGAHYAASKEDDSSVKDSSLIHLTASTSIAGFSPYLGYIKVDDDADFPGWTSTGETIDPMEEGDHIYRKGADTIYVGVSKSFGDLSATLLYGRMNFEAAKDYTVNETTLWLGYPITKDLKANLGYTAVSGENDWHEDYDQLNLTLIYSF